MSGEDSKDSGEIGEKLAGALFRMIGWENTINGLTIDCALRTKHDGVGTHGIDKLFVYNNPFFDGVTDIVTVSVKHKAKGYQRTGGGIRSELKKHIGELCRIVACAKFSPKVKEKLNSYPRRKHEQHKGLLVWLHGNRETLNADIRDHLGSAELSADHNVPVYLIDSGKASFIFSAISHFERGDQRNDYKFYYPRLGNVITQDLEQSGNVLPLELIASDMIPIKHEKDGKDALTLYVRDRYSLSTLIKAYAIALDFGSGWVSDISIGFEDYTSSADHIRIWNTAKLSFPDIKASLSVFSYDNNLLSLLER